MTFKQLLFKKIICKARLQDQDDDDQKIKTVVAKSIIHSVTFNNNVSADSTLFSLQ